MYYAHFIYIFYLVQAQYICFVRFNFLQPYYFTHIFTFYFHKRYLKQKSTLALNRLSVYINVHQSSGMNTKMDVSSLTYINI